MGEILGAIIMVATVMMFVLPRSESVPDVIQGITGLLSTNIRAVLGTD